METAGEESYLSFVIIMVISGLCVYQVVLCVQEPNRKELGWNLDESGFLLFVLMTEERMLTNAGVVLADNSPVCLFRLTALRGTV